MRQSWTDDRLDDFKDQVNQRFDSVDRRLDALDQRLDGIQQTMVHAFIGMTVAMVTGFAALSGLIVALWTQI